MRDQSWIGLGWALARAYPRVSLCAALLVVGVATAGVAWGPCAVCEVADPQSDTPSQPSPLPEGKPAVEVPPIGGRATCSPSEPEQRGKGVMLVDHGELRSQQRVDVLAEASADTAAAVEGYLAREVLIDAGQGPRWVPGDVIAIGGREARSSVIAGYADDGFRDIEGDLDGDGCRDRLWHAVERRVNSDDKRVFETGYLVYDGCCRSALTSLGFRDGWGHSEKVTAQALRDVVGGPGLDLIVVVNTTVAEAGDDGLRLFVFRIDAQGIEQVLDHPVGNPLGGTGLAQYEVGHVQLRNDGSIFARTMVAAAQKDLLHEVHVREQTFLRNKTGDFDRHESIVPLRTADGERIVGFTGYPVGVDPHSEEKVERWFILKDGSGKKRTRGPLADRWFQEAFDLEGRPAPLPMDSIEGLWAPSENPEQ